MSDFKCLISKSQIPYCVSFILTFTRNKTLKLYVWFGNLKSKIENDNRAKINKGDAQCLRKTARKIEIEKRGN